MQPTGCENASQPCQTRACLGPILGLHPPCACPTASPPCSLLPKPILPDRNTLMRQSGCRSPSASAATPCAELSTKCLSRQTGAWRLRTSGHVAEMIADSSTGAGSVACHSRHTFGATMNALKSQTTMTACSEWSATNQRTLINDGRTGHARSRRCTSLAPRIVGPALVHDAKQVAGQDDHLRSFG